MNDNYERLASLSAFALRTAILASPSWCSHLSLVCILSHLTQMSRTKGPSSGPKSYVTDLSQGLITATKACKAAWDFFESEEM
jgi:hypothetical protein